MFPGHQPVVRGRGEGGKEMKNNTLMTQSLVLPYGGGLAVPKGPLIMHCSQHTFNVLFEKKFQLLHF